MLIPSHMRDGMERYMNHGIGPGDFAMSVLENDFHGACCRADYINKGALASWGDFLSYCPYESYGSPGKVEQWMKTGGLNGRVKEVVNG